MKVDAGRALGSLDPQRVYQQLEDPAVKSSFADSLKSALSEVNALQEQRDAMVDGMVSGKVSEVHEIMTAAEEAQLAFELVLEVRNRLLESYQELMRMQV
jgi:flagellar hook-basal body complex protein FliE